MKTILEVIEEQTTFPSDWETKDYFICRKCSYWRGGCSCKNNVFIAVVGGNTSRCVHFKEEK
jgi:hypothetical protein